jgi:hypothetical protein
MIVGGRRELHSGETFERLDGSGGVRVRSDQLEKPHKKVDDGNAHRDRGVTLQDGRKHGDAVFGEGVRRRSEPH